ncbi:hypothetical protein NC652_010320 [Populus alba x Populus x berolinensis]|nr:hypothetical protein NC652_010320 [Populus alba x Populus x berolinensis]
MESNANPQDLKTQICNYLKQTQLQNAGSRPGLSGSAGSRVDRPGRPGSAGSLHRPDAGRSGVQFEHSVEKRGLMCQPSLQMRKEKRFSSEGTKTVSVTAHASRLLSLTPTMHAVTKPRPHGILWPYKIQRKATNRGGQRKKDANARREDQGTEDEKETENLDRKTRGGGRQRELGRA